METIGVDENCDVRAKSAVVDTEEGTTQRQVMPVKGVLDSLSPLINSMRPLGLYFTRRPRVGPAAESRTLVGRCRNWNPGRIYASVMLALTWLYAVRYCVVFNHREFRKTDLFAQLMLIPSAFLTNTLQTAYYVASHTGSLDRIFRQASSSMVDFTPKYSRRAKVLTAVCWLLAVANIAHYIYLMRIDSQFNYMSLTFILGTLRQSKPCMGVVKAVLCLLQLQSVATWAFTQAMN